MVTKHKMKNTEIGFIPEDWDICSLDNEFTFIKSNSLSREQLNYAHGSVANIHYGDILTKFGENIDIKRTQLPLINHSAEFTPSPKDILKTGDKTIIDRFYFVGHEDSNEGMSGEIKITMDIKGNLSDSPWEGNHIRRSMLKLLRLGRQMNEENYNI